MIRDARYADLFGVIAIWVKPLTTPAPAGRFRCVVDARHGLPPMANHAGPCGAKFSRKSLWLCRLLAATDSLRIGYTIWLQLATDVLG